MYGQTDVRTYGSTDTPTDRRTWTHQKEIESFEVRIAEAQNRTGIVLLFSFHLPEVDYLYFLYSDSI